jgi:uncharacterized phage protein (TIGR02216 family)
MTCIAWPQLMRLGLTELGLTPDVFWGLTPVELMLMAGLGDGPGMLTRADLSDLTARFPDTPSGMDLE